MFDILLDNLIDLAKIFPFIFLVYVLIELLEANKNVRKKMKHVFAGRFSPIFGSAVGLIPQCGFSIVATNLYQGGFILVGTLIAVYLATSDEAIPILLSRAITDPSIWGKLGLLLAIKLVYAVIAGLLLNLLFNRKTKDIEEFEENEGADEGCCHHHIEGKRETLKKFLLHPFVHSLKIALYIFIINFAFGCLIELAIGEDALKNFLSQSVYFQPIFSCIIGLIPNCASSVLITEMYADGLLSLGGAIAGLAVNSGIGMAVLLKDKTNLKRNLGIVALTFALALLLGYMVTAVEVII